MNNNCNSTQQMSTLKEYIKALIFDYNSILDDVPTIVGFIDQTENSKLEFSSTSSRKYSKPYQNIDELKQILVPLIPQIYLYIYYTKINNLI